MKRIIECLAAALIGVCSTAVSGAEVTSVPHGTSPDGAYLVQVLGPTERGEPSLLSLMSSRGGNSVGSTVLDSYAVYPLNTGPENLGVLWSSDSRHFALMVRGLKRSWTTSIRAAADRELKGIVMPSATSKALALLDVSGNFRVCRETPQKWLNADHLVVRASGDATVDKRVIWYEVEITYSIAAREITESKLISITPHDG